MVESPQDVAELEERLARRDQFLRMIVVQGEVLYTV